MLCLMSTQVVMHLNLFLFPVFAGSATEHTATIIDGKAIAQQVQLEIAVKVSKMKESVGKAPGLAVILVGIRKDTEMYKSRRKLVRKLGLIPLVSSCPTTQPRMTY